MQSENKNGSFQLSSRYQQYDFAKRHLRGTPRPKVFPIKEADGTTDEGYQPYPPQSEVAQTIRTRYGNGTGSHIIRIPEATKKGYAEARPGQAINLSVMGSKTRRGRVSDVAQTLDTGMQQHTLTEDMQVRRLTPIECERLQGFPSGWTEGLSDTQRYKCLGNAVTVNVIEEIIKRSY